LPVIGERTNHNSRPADADGWTRTTIPTESVRQAGNALMQLGADVEVLDPSNCASWSRAARGR
jgi:hypothetical protein